VLKKSQKIADEGVCIMAVLSPNLELVSLASSAEALKKTTKDDITNFAAVYVTEVTARKFPVPAGNRIGSSNL
jgi:hypothetical protein